MIFSVSGLSTFFNTANDHTGKEPIACPMISMSVVRSSVVSASEFKSEDLGFDPMVGQG